jgi:tripartite-type tricarboxylate transporter receptor subunit TctC
MGLKRISARQILSGVLLTCMAGVHPSLAEDFYQGKTIKFIVGSAAGGNYDGMARLLARHVGKHIPGSPAVVVQNLPGGAGMAATNHVFTIAAKDGTEIGMFNRATLFAPLLGENVAKYKVEEFNWLGSPASYSNNAYIFIIRGYLPYKTFDELRRADPPLNVGTANSVINSVIKEALGVRMKLIRGYLGNGLDLAFEAGEVDAIGTSYSTVLGAKASWLQNNFGRIMTQFGSGTRLPELADVPTARELAQNDADRDLIEFSEGALTLGYPVAAPPGLPADRVSTLKTALGATMADPEFRADVERANLEYSPRDGAELHAAVVRFSQTPPAIRERYKRLAAESGG